MQNAIQIGDLVTFLDEVGEGCVIAVDGNQVQVQVGDFSRWHDLEELIPRDRAMDHLLSNGPVKQKDLEIQAINEPALPSMQAAKLGAREVDLHLHELPRCISGYGSRKVTPSTTLCPNCDHPSQILR
jgi:hypothetical protein